VYTNTQNQVKTFTDYISIAKVGEVVYVNRGSDISGTDIERVIRNLKANAGKGKIALHTKAVDGGKLGNRFTVAEFEKLEARKDIAFVLRSGWTNFKTRDGGMTTPYLSLVSLSTEKKITPSKSKKQGATKVVD
jgi:hypothetical protein|tara:strand:+ start:492 stop:893 length:402 start_codon:yes stop_codon:yes gene_type:complete